VTSYSYRRRPRTTSPTPSGWSCPSAATFLTWKNLTSSWPTCWRSWQAEQDVGGQMPTSPEVDQPQAGPAPTGPGGQGGHRGPACLLPGPDGARPALSPLAGAQKGRGGTSRRGVPGAAASIDVLVRRRREDGAPDPDAVRQSLTASLGTRLPLVTRTWLVAAWARALHP
jgi:hypothetical protein